MIARDSVGGRMRFLFIAVMCFALAGCAVAAWNDYEAAEARYKDCLKAHPAALQKCEDLRLAMEAADRKYTDIAGAHPTTNLSVLNR
jgi:hypothetical protein